jgi:Skp family chaperone for outer membrane proteins
VGADDTGWCSASITTWTTQLSTLEARAAEHDRYSSELLLQVADPLKNIAARYEDIRKSHAEYALKLEKERDMSYADLKKTKGRYDGACQEVESRRKKTDSSFDYGKNKAQNAYQQQLMEMRNVKVFEPAKTTFSLILTVLEYVYSWD